MKESLLALVCMAGGLTAQTQVDLRSQSKDVDFSGAVSTTPWKVGAALPAVCAVGRVFFNTAAPSGQNVYLCTALNTWTAATTPGVRFTSGAGAPAGNCTAGQDLYTDTLNQDTWLCETSNTWKKALTTTNIGPFALTGQNGTVPAAAVSGNTILFFNTTAKIAQSVDDAGNLGTMVRPTDCSPGSQAVQKIDSNGNPVCAAAGGAETQTLVPLTCSGTGVSYPMWWLPFGTGIVSSCPSTAGQYLGYLHWNDDGTHGNFAIVPQVVPAGWSGRRSLFYLLRTWFDHPHMGSENRMPAGRRRCRSYQSHSLLSSREQDVIIAASGGRQSNSLAQLLI